MDAQTFLTECLIRGIRIKTDGENLLVDFKGSLEPATAGYIRQNKTEIIDLLLHQEHGDCVGCGEDTECMLTASGQDWCWMCSACFDIRGTRQLTAKTEQRFAA